MIQDNTVLAPGYIIDRCLEIEKEYDSIETIHLSSENIEDVDDVYQAKLEQKWFKEELEEEYAELNRKLGYKNRKLAIKSSRRNP